MLTETLEHQVGENEADPNVEEVVSEQDVGREVGGKVEVDEDGSSIDQQQPQRDQGQDLFAWFPVRRLHCECRDNETRFFCHHQVNKQTHLYL